MRFYAVIGLVFGDEGKGQTVNNLCTVLKSPIVIRYCGGPQAGHNVIYKDVKHIFSSFGSGTLQNIPTYISKYCQLNPISLMREYDVLIDKGINPVVYIDPRCQIITPRDKEDNEKDGSSHGSCLCGIANAIERNLANFSLLAIDLKHENILKMKIDEIYDHYHNVKFMTPDPRSEFYSAIKRINSNKNIRIKVPNFLSYESIVFESSQGILLDRNFGFFPHVSRGNTGTKNILEILRDEFKVSDSELHLNLVTRAYQTRHGNGPMTNDSITFPINYNPNEINVFNNRQGIFRKSMLDIDLLLYSLDSDEYIKNSSNKRIIVTCIDDLNKFKFTYKGGIYTYENKIEFLKGIEDITKVKTILGGINNEEEYYNNLIFNN